MYKFEYLFDEERETVIGNIKNSETNKIQYLSKLKTIQSMNY